MEIGTRDVESPVVMSRRETPANQPLQHLDAGHLGASKPQYVMSRPAVPDLCIASTNLLSLMDPLAELQLYVDDHAAHLANCASADDDSIALMSAELLPRLEGWSEQQ